MSVEASVGCTTWRLAAVALVAFLSAGSTPGFADRVVTRDGRVIEVKKARQKGDGYELELEHGTIVLPDASAVKEVEIEGDMSEYVPRNDDEREKLEQGYVRFEGKWLSKASYENELRRRFEESRARADELATHANWHNAWERETQHFVVRTNTSPELLEYYAELLEAFYDMMDGRIGIKPSPTLRRAKMAVNIYRGYQEFQELGNPTDNPGVVGFFDSRAQSLNFYHDYSDPVDSEETGLHECTHLITYLLEPQYVSQIWLNEGAADYFGCVTIERDRRGRLALTPGRLLTPRVLTVQQALRDEKALTLEELFHTEREAFTAFHYAHAWSFLYFLNTADGGRRYAKAFDKFFKELYTLAAKGVDYETVNHWNQQGMAKRASPEGVVSHLLARLKVRDLGELETEWRDFVAAIPVDAPEALLKRGIHHIRRGKFDEALPDLEAAIDAGLDSALVWASRARARSLATESEPGEEATADMRKAIDLDPLNPVYRYDMSLLLAGYPALGGFAGNVGPEREDDSIDHPEAKVQAGLAHDLDPENPRFAEWLARFR